MLRVRRSHAAFGRGTLRFLYPKNRKVLAYLREHEDETILCVANLSRTPQAVELDLSAFAGRVPVEMTGGSLFPPIGQLTYLLTLPPYGFYWFLLASAERSRRPGTRLRRSRCRNTSRWSCATRLADALATLAAPALEREVLPAYLAEAALVLAPRTRASSRTQFAYLAPLPGGDRETAAGRDRGRDRRTARPALAGAARRSPGRTSRRPRLPRQLALARVRRGRRVGLLTDAFALPAFAHAMLAALAERRARSRRPTARSSSMPADGRARCAALPPDAPVHWLSAEQSNSSLIVGDAVMLKLFRQRLAPASIPKPR